MATVQERNAELVELLTPDFIRNRYPLIFPDPSGGGWGEWAFQDVAGTTQTLIADGVLDVTALLSFDALVVTSSAVKLQHVGTLIPGGSVALYSSGSDILTLACSAGGAVTLVRTGGALTYDVRLRLQWI